MGNSLQTFVLETPTHLERNLPFKNWVCVVHIRIPKNRDGIGYRSSTAEDLAALSHAFTFNIIHVGLLLVFTYHLQNPAVLLQLSKTTLAGP